MSDLDGDYAVEAGAEGGPKVGGGTEAGGDAGAGIDGEAGGEGGAGTEAGHSVAMKEEPLDPLDYLDTVAHRNRLEFDCHFIKCNESNVRIFLLYLGIFPILSLVTGKISGMMPSDRPS